MTVLPGYVTEVIMTTKNKHMTPEMRSVIESELALRTSFKRIASVLGKDCTTVSKEIRNHILKKKTGSVGAGFNDCVLHVTKKCKRKNVCTHCFSGRNRYCWSCGKCISSCHDYVPYPCPSLQKPPYVCNGCLTRNKCSLEKSYYSASVAQKEYEKLRSQSRSGVAISEEELRHLDSVISPLLQKGQSLHHISVNCLDLTMTSERTLYSYINQGLLSARNIDMPRTVRMRPRKNKKRNLKVDKACRIGRTWEEFQAYLQQHPDTAIRQLDSVEGVRGGKVLLTIHFVQQELQLAFLRDANDSRSVIDIFEKMYLELRPDVFIRLFPLLLADNGSEFSNPKAIEFDKQGNRRTQMYYCDPSAPFQKGSCENNHQMIRRIIPKGTDLGNYSQEQINLMMSHINSYARPNLGDKSPYDLFAFLYGEEILKYFGLTKIPAGEIILKPCLLHAR